MTSQSSSSLKLLTSIGIWLLRERRSVLSGICILNPKMDSYFQCGVSNFLLAKYELACQYFEETIVHLRGQQLMYVLTIWMHPI